MNHYLIILNSTTNLKIAHLNARSINLKAKEINNYITQNNIQLLTINETWLNSNESYINLPKNFSIIRLDRIGKKGGGVAIIYHINLKIKN